MTKIGDVFAVHATDRLDYALISRIFRTGFSRIPVWEDEHHKAIVGMLYAKDLMVGAVVLRHGLVFISIFPRCSVYRYCSSYLLQPASLFSRLSISLRGSAST